MELATGSMVTGDPDKANQYGFVLHWLMMGHVVYGLVAALVYQLFL